MMTTLTQTAYYTRRVIAFLGIFLVTILVGRALLNASRALIAALRPEPPPKPTVSFGKLPPLQFPERKNLPDLEIELETIEGRLPIFDNNNIGQVYFMPQKNVSLLSLERADGKAEKMKLKQDPIQLSKVLYRWESTTSPKTYLEMDINSENFYYRHQFEETPTFEGRSRIPGEEQIVAEAKSWLRRFDFMPTDINNGEGEVTYLRYAPPELLPAISVSESNFARVNLFREDLDEKRILPPDPRNSNISVLIAAIPTIKERVVEVNYTYYAIDREIFATYPLKSVNQAWKELLEGQGFIAHLGENQNGQITVRKVTLAFYDSDQPQNFLQPIYLFEGDNDFYAYVPAIAPEWTE